MSWLQLLTIGRSWGRVGDRPSRYKMTQQSLLPRFGKAKPGDEDVLSSETARKAGPQAFVEPSTVSARSRENAVNDRKNMSTVEAPSPAVQAAATTMPQPAFPLGRWTLFRKPFTNPPKPKICEAPVQGELSLDSVKPVRNDLTDADLEIVGTKRGKSVSSAPQIEDQVWRPEEHPLFVAGKT